jgi:hypothetical protein
MTKVVHKFAWLPTFIRNNVKYCGYVNPHWVWLRRYTRVYKFDIKLARYRTVNTVLGHIDAE